MFSAAFSQSFAGGVRLPLAWAIAPLPAGKVGTLLAQVALLRGEVAVLSGDGRLVIAGRDLVGPAGKVYAFASPESAAMWRDIAEQRSRRELELARGMGESRRAVWLARKRRRLEFDAARRIERAQHVADAGIRAALIADAGFALEKWGHYA